MGCFGPAADFNILKSAIPSEVERALLTGFGDFDIGARYTWANVGSPLTHIALALEASLPSGDPIKGMSEGAYGLSPSILLSREFSNGRYQAFSTAGFDLVLVRRSPDPAGDIPRHAVFVNSGFS